MSSLNKKRIGCAQSTEGFYTLYRFYNSISEILNIVNKNFPDILSKDVLRHFDRSIRPEGDLGENVLFSIRPDRAVREALAERVYRTTRQLRSKLLANSKSHNSFSRVKHIVV